MDKSKLIDFISRYHLGNLIEAVVWETDNDTLSTNFISSEQAIFGLVTMNNFKSFESNLEFGVLTTSQLIKMLGTVGDDISLDMLKIEKDGQQKIVAIKIDDSITHVNYMLSDLAVITRPKNRNLQQQPDYNFTMDLTKDFADRFIKAKGALAETKAVTIIKNRNGVYQVVLGYSEIDTNRIYIDVDVDEKRELTNPVSFSADYMKEVLSANKGATSAFFEVTDEGMAHIHASTEEFTCDYYLAEVETD